MPGVNDRLPAWLPDSRTIIFERKTTTPGEQQAQQNHDAPPCGPSPLDAVHNSTLWRIDTHTLAEAPLFDASAPPAGFSQLMPTIAPDGKRLAFTSDRNASGVRDVGVRLWVANIDGSGSRLVSEGTTGPRDLEHNDCVMPVEQKAPAWSADSQHIAVLEGIEEVYMSPFTHMSSDPRVRFATRSRDQLLTSTWCDLFSPLAAVL